MRKTLIDNENPRKTLDVFTGLSVEKLTYFKFKIFFSPLFFKRTPTFLVPIES